jgi:OOP family OmpA-OmpF porin
MRARELALGDVDLQVADQWTVNFAFDSAELGADAQATLDRVASEVREDPGAIVDIYGHADSVGPDAYNDWLSGQRAQGVLRYLLDQSGEPLGRFASIGLGESKPVNDGGQENRDASRRVVVTLLERVDGDSAGETLQVSRVDR